MTFFHYRIKVVKHPQRDNNPCMRILQLFFTPLTRSQVDELDKEDLIRCKHLKRQGLVKTYSELPVTRAFGPLNDFR